MPAPEILSFRRYISTRKYHQGRGSSAGWAFVAHALGDPKLPNAATWDELRAYLIQSGVDHVMLEAANIVWRSYGAHVSKARRTALTGTSPDVNVIARRRQAASNNSSRALSCASPAE